MAHRRFAQENPPDVSHPLFAFIATDLDRSASVSAATSQASGGKRKLSYLEAREYAGIEAAVEAAEERLQRARHMIEDPAVAVDAVRLTAALAEIEAAQTEADGLYARWAELTEKAG